MFLNLIALAVWILLLALLVVGGVFAVWTGRRRAPDDDRAPVRTPRPRRAGVR
ncbi:hypothetical protein P9139_02265 [Curtobacterium flaccumfaciens]|nr:hypothetical protein P9139_02265 [Curtobacterium flaccumfaciens]